MKTMNCPVTKFIDSKMQRFDPLWQAQNGVGGLRSRYYDKTGVAKYREWRGPVSYTHLTLPTNSRV